MWRSLASEDAECPLLVKKASDTLAELLKEPETYDNITKDFKYGGHAFLLHSVVHTEFIFSNLTLVKVKHEQAGQESFRGQSHGVKEATFLLHSVFRCLMFQACILSCVSRSA